MSLRNIIEIDSEKCDGCGLCIPGCEEGAIQIVDGKAVLVSDNLCDGIGNCLGHCPKDALVLIERDADEFDEEAVKSHLGSAAAPKCSGSATMSLERSAISGNEDSRNTESELTQWPVLLRLVSEDAPYLSGRELLVAADCAPVAYGNFHTDLLKGRSIVVGCPKWDDLNSYTEKLTSMLKINDIPAVVVGYIDAPCCAGLLTAVEKAVSDSGKAVPIVRSKISKTGELEIN